VTAQLLHRTTAHSIGEQELWKTPGPVGADTGTSTEVAYNLSAVVAGTGMRYVVDQSEPNEILCRMVR
jgi:hypothetical protein